MAWTRASMQDGLLDLLSVTLRMFRALPLPSLRIGQCVVERMP